MASTYDETAFRRMAYDADGSVVLHNHSSNSPYPGTDASPPDPWTLTSALIRTQLNDEAMYTTDLEGLGNYSYVVVCVLFPEKRDIDGLYWNIHPDSDVHDAYVSADSTNGIDGTWTDTNIAPHEDLSPNVYDFRNDISATALTGKTAIRAASRVGVADNVQFYTLHIYGTIAASETPDRLLYLDTENEDAEFTKLLDFGDRPRGETVIRTFKLKNNSSTKTITSVQVTAEDLMLEAGDWYTFSKDGVAYQATLNTIGNITAGSTQLVYAKRVIADAATIGPQTGRIKASHTAVT